jgi:hypothetical protein
MSRPLEYAWFIAVVWPDETGAPTATIYAWDRLAGRMGRQVDAFRFDAERPFRQQVEQRYYEVVDGQLADPVMPTGVRIALRRETVPVTVPASEYVFA